MGEAARIIMLGPLSLSREDGSEATPSAPKERKVLTLLLFNYARVVPVSLLLDELWGDHPPKTARTALQTYVLNIRREISDKFGLPPDQVRNELLVTRSEGYLFQIHRSYFDLHEYLRLVDVGERAIRDGDDVGAVESFKAAESLWQGSILSDVEHGLPLGSEIIRLEQLRLASQELRIESELRLGRYRELVGELSMLTLQHPFHERLHEYLMLALYYAGRRVQALEVFQRLRASMAKEMGLDPSSRVQKLQRDILGSGTPGHVGLLSRADARD